jgi:hypothetical protein
MSTACPAVPSSDACKSCESDLGASSCAPDDSVCLYDQCMRDKNCFVCGVPCQCY